jgi:hypothetical protein
MNKLIKRAVALLCWMMIMIYGMKVPDMLINSVVSLSTALKIYYLTGYVLSSILFLFVILGKEE